MKAMERLHHTYEIDTERAPTTNVEVTDFVNYDLTLMTL